MAAQVYSIKRRGEMCLTVRQQDILGFEISVYNILSPQEAQRLQQAATHLTHLTQVLENNHKYKTEQIKVLNQEHKA